MIRASSDSVRESASGVTVRVLLATPKPRVTADGTPLKSAAVVAPEVFR